MKAFCLNTNTRIRAAETVEHKLRAAFNAHFDLVSIHPLGDGNGRTSRLFMNFVQTLFGLPMSVVFVSDRFLYIEALEQARREGNLVSFYDFMFRQYGKFLTLEMEALKE